MTESQWLTARDPRPLLRFANRPDVLRRFAVACVRALSDRLLSRYGTVASQLWPDVLDMADRCAGHRASQDEVGALIWELNRRAGGMTLFGVGAESDNEMQYRLLTVPFTREDAQEASRGCVYRGCSTQRTDDYLYTHESDMVWDTGRPSERQSRLLALHATFAREIIGNPFRPVDVDPSWLTDTVLALARRADESGDFSVMPILADALSDAGCDDASVLDHCRSCGPHVRGCWALNLVLEWGGPTTRRPHDRSGASGARPTT